MVPPPASRMVTSAVTASVGVVDATDILLNDVEPDEYERARESQ